MANANSENPYVGRKFQELVQSILEKEFSTSFEQEAVVAIGKPPKGHKFDLANEDRSNGIDLRGPKAHQGETQMSKVCKDRAKEAGRQ